MSLFVANTLFLPAFPGNWVYLLLGFLAFFATVLWRTLPRKCEQQGSLRSLPVRSTFYCLFYDTNAETPLAFFPAPRFSWATNYTACKYSHLQSLQSLVFPPAIELLEATFLYLTYSALPFPLPLCFPIFFLYFQPHINTGNKENTTPGYFSTPVLQMLPAEQMRASFMILWRFGQGRLATAENTNTDRYRSAADRG